jgi:hypothetical protein
MKENFSRVICCSIKGILFGTDHTWISDGSEVNSISVMVVLSKEFIENFAYAIDG